MISEFGRDHLPVILVPQTPEEDPLRRVKLVPADVNSSLRSE